MIYFGLALLCIAAIYFALRLRSLKHSLAKAAGELREISEELEENRVVKLAAPEKELESLLEAINGNLHQIRRERGSYREKERQLKEEIENISHDLRTPLTAVLGYLKMIDREGLSAEDREFLETAIRKAGTLQELTERFYELSRVTSGDFTLEQRPVDAARILREACLDHYSLFEQARLEMEVRIPETQMIILGNEEALIRVFGNLLQNGIRYARNRLSVGLEEEKDSIRITFSNDITPEQELPDPSRLFDRFYVQERSRSQGGTGLGLTISRSLAEHMQGTVTAEYSGEKENRFLVFILQFPKG